MTIVRLGTVSLRAAAVFKDPILAWTGEVPARFFKALYGALDETLYIQPSDLSAQGGNSLGDCSATLRIFGGTSTVTLRSNGVIVEFPGIAPERILFSNNVIGQAYRALQKEFSELSVRTVEATMAVQFDLISDEKFGDFIRALNNPDFIGRAEGVPAVVVDPSVRLRLISEDAGWSARVTVDKSEVFDNGLFLLRELIINNEESVQDADKLFEIVNVVDTSIFQILNLEFEKQE